MSCTTSKFTAAPSPRCWQNQFAEDEPILLSGSTIKKEFKIKIAEKVKHCNGYCIGKQIILDATLANGEQVSIRNVHFSCIPKVAAAEVFCGKPCSSGFFTFDKMNKSMDRTIGSLKRVLKKPIGDFSFEKGTEKMCCCKDAKCAKKLDGRLRLAVRSNFKIN